MIDRILIPARKGSKGLPYKNRKLMKYTFDSIPPCFIEYVDILSDDIVIIEEAISRGFNIVYRPSVLSEDHISTQDLIKFYIRSKDLDNSANILMLYLTYPERKWSDILSAVSFYNKSKAKSMLCRKEIKTSPYLMLKDTGKHTGTQIIPHDLYRRQDYPTCFELSHFISIFEVSEIYKLNNNLYNNSTIFYKIDDVLDVDLQSDLNKIL